MNREAALLGTPTYTVFAGKLAAVDAELIRRGRMFDLRKAGLPRLERKAPSDAPPVPGERRDALMRVITAVLDDTE